MRKEEINGDKASRFQKMINKNARIVLLEMQGMGSIMKSLIDLPFLFYPDPDRT